MTDGDELDAAIRRMWRDLDAHGTLGAFADYAASVPAAQHPALQAEHQAIARCRDEREAPSPADGARRLLGGRYEIRGELARGGMAVVYRAHDVVLGRPVVLKTTPAGVLRNAHARRQLEREARALGKIENRGICPILDVVEDAGAYHVVLPLIAGDTLAARIAAARGERGTGEPAADGAAGDDALGVGVAVGGRARSFPARRAQPGLGRLLEFVARVARAVHAAHEVGIVHRDLKPSNIMVKPDGEPVVLDFGLAIDEGSDSRRSTAAARDGTPAYMAPEQLDGAWDRIDRRTDVHALGVVLYEALTLEHPFAARNHAALVAKIMAGRHRALRQVDRTLPSALEAVCAKAMHVDPAQRYVSALEFAEELERVVRSEPTRARPARPWRRCGQWVRRNALAAIAFALALAATSVAVGVWLQKQAAQRYPRAFLHYSQARGKGLAPDAADLDVLARLCPDPAELASFLRDPADPSQYELMQRRVLEFAATRGADGSFAGRLVQPRETIVEREPAFRFEVPDTGTATWSLVLTVWSEGLPAVVTEVREHRGPATTITVAVPRDRLPPGPTYHWTVRRAAEEDPEHPLFAPAPASFRFADAASRDALLARVVRTGAADLDVLLRANALLVAGFVADAGRELARLRADAPRHERRLACSLGAEVALRLGDRQEFERMRRLATSPGESR